jgi:hypothetical protein
MGLSKIGTHQHSRLTWRVISGEKEKILKNCQNEPTSKTNSNPSIMSSESPVSPLKENTSPASSSLNMTSSNVRLIGSEVDFLKKLEYETSVDVESQENLCTIFYRILAK